MPRQCKQAKFDSDIATAASWVFIFSVHKKHLYWDETGELTACWSTAHAACQILLRWCFHFWFHFTTTSTSNLHFYNSGSKYHLRVLLSHWEAFRSWLELSGLCRAPPCFQMLCPDLSFLIILGGPWVVSSKACLSFLSAGVSVSQGDGGGEEPLVSQDAVPGCCFLVLLPCLEWEDSQRWKQAATDVFSKS